MKEKISIALIGSGSGSTGEAAIKAFQAGAIPSVGEVKAFISTVPGAGLLEKAEKLNVAALVVDDSRKDVWGFEHELFTAIKNLDIDLLVSAGCRKAIPEVPDVLCINTHPQDTEKHGGQYMVGIEPHLHFLEYEIMDQLRRERATIETPFYAMLTSHSCHGRSQIKSETVYDCSATLMQVPILIPQSMIVKAWEIRKPFRKSNNWLKECSRRLEMVNLAEEIQQHVLFYERQLLPMFIENAAIQLLR